VYIGKVMAFVKSKWNASKFDEKINDEALSRVTNDSNPAFVRWSSQWYTYQISDIEVNKIYATGSLVTTSMNITIELTPYIQGVGDNVNAVYTGIQSGYKIGPALYKSSSYISEYIYSYGKYNNFTGFYQIPYYKIPHALYTTAGMTTSQAWYDVLNMSNAILPVVYNGPNPYLTLTHTISFSNVNTATSLVDPNCSMGYGMTLYFYGFLR
jgi:hypothetical protein